MKVLITGGGTGGHIYPAIAIAKKIKQEIPDIDILYVGTKNGLESDIVPKEGIEFKTVRVKGFQRKLSPDTFKSLTELALGLNDARKIIRRYSPDLVIGTGGYVCGPIVFLASLARIPTMIHEQNAFPGITNKILSKFVSKIACSFEEARRYFSNKEKIQITGNPIREDLLKINRLDAIKELGLEESAKTILSFGGSGGQRSLNDCMFDYIMKKSKDPSMQIIHITGKRFYESFKSKLEENGMADLPENIRVMEYCYEIPKYLVASDIVVTSAGAITIAEITALGKPSILIPKKNTAENHQEHNARALEKRGASLVLLEDELSDVDFTEKLDSLISDKDALSEMGMMSKAAGIVDANERIFKVVRELLGN